MKKILIISASQQKKGAGAKAIEMFVTKFDINKYSMEVITLSDYKIDYCKGCTACFKTKECILKDDVKSIIEKMKSSDGIIFVTPIYAMNISGLFKTFIDRTSYMLHKPALFEKHSYIIMTSDLGGFKAISMYLRYMMNAFGINNTGYFGVMSKKIKNNEDYQKKLSATMDAAATKFKDALSTGKNYNPKFTQVLRFNLWKNKAIISKDFYPGDYKHWEENDWLDKEYYYPIKMNIAKRLFLKIILRKIKKKILNSIL